MADQTYHLFIRASPERVWEAIAAPGSTERYWFGVRLETTALPGTPYRQYAPDGAMLVDEQVLDADPPRRLVTGWRSLYDPDLVDEPASRVTWLLEDADDGVVLLTLVHDRLDAAPRTAAAVEGTGWMRVLSGLKTLLETGEPLVRA